MASAHTDSFCRDNLPPREQWPELLFDLPELGYPERLNAAQELLTGAPDDPCMRGGGEDWTYGELRRHAAHVAAVLTDDLGLVPGNRVLLRGPNEPWQVACWLGVLLAGGVAVATMPMLRRSELDAITELALPSLALVHHGFTDEVPPGLRTVAYAGDAELTERAAAKDGEFSPVPTAADDVALLAFTSGTTGRPKATMHFHRDVLAMADTFARHIVRIEPADVVIGTPPIAFTFGLGGLVVFPLRAGASTVLLDRRVTPPQLADAVAEHRATVLFTAPTAYRAIIAAGKAEEIKGVRRAVSAGETLPAAVWHAVHDATGIRIIDGIGSTEMLHVFISAADDDIRPGTTGRAVPGYRAAVLDDDGHPVPDGRPGNLAVKGPTGCRYLHGDRQENYVRFGWNFTGDTYVRDADGYFTYLARSDDMIVSSGYNISGPEVEQALIGHPDVVDCAVVGTPDEQRGAVVTAYVVLREGAARDVHALQDHVKQTIAPYKYPRIVEFVPDLPRTTTGKLQRYVLRERAAGGR